MNQTQPTRGAFAKGYVACHINQLSVVVRRPTVFDHTITHVSSQRTPTHAYGMVVTATTTFLSTPSDLDVLGLSASADGNQVLLTIQDDGVVAYDVVNQVETIALNMSA